MNVNVVTKFMIHDGKNNTFFLTTTTGLIINRTLSLSKNYIPIPAEATYNKSQLQCTNSLYFSVINQTLHFLVSHFNTI